MADAGLPEPVYNVYKQNEFMLYATLKNNLNNLDLTTSLTTNLTTSGEVSESVQ